MKNFKIALVQMKSPLRQKERNLESMVAWTRKAKKAGAAFVFFPELSITGHGGHESMVTDAEPVPDGPSVGTLRELASELNLHICAGIAEDERGIHYNTQFIIGPDGYIGKQPDYDPNSDDELGSRLYNNFIASAGVSIFIPKMKPRLYDF